MTSVIAPHAQTPSSAEARALASVIKTRWRAGEPSDTAAALERHPELKGARSVVLDLAYEEYCQRCQAGESVDVADFCGRFPDHASALYRLLEVHHYLEDNPELLGAREPSWPEPGQTFLGFVLRRELGRGGIARVFLAEEPALGRRLVVVKLSAEHGAAEAEFLGRLAHRNVVPVHSTAEAPGTGLTATCMPYLGSATLEDVLRGVFAGPNFPTRAGQILEAVRAVRLDGAPAEGQGPDLRRGSYTDGVLRLGVELAEALDFIHSRGIVHHDLKPANILVTAAGRPMLLDFNLSREQAASPKRLGGTPHYMAPEQLLALGSTGPADLSALDGRADVFSLGVVLYQLLSGVYPFGNLPSDLPVDELLPLVLERQRQGAPPLRPGCAADGPLCRLVERCLRWGPADRPTAAELARGLRSGLRPSRRGRRWARQHPIRAGLLAGVLLLSCLAAALMWAFTPSYAALRFQDGLAAYRQGHYQDAVEHFSRALEADPELAGTHFARARAYQQLGAVDPENYQRALVDYYKAPPNGPCQACIGFCLSQHREHQGAIRRYEQAVQGGFAPAEVFNDLGQSYLAAGKLEPALEHLDRALQLNPGLQPAYYGRAQVYSRLAAKQFRLVSRSRAAPTSPAFGQLTFYRNQAAADFLKAFQLGPASTDVRKDAATLCALRSPGEALPSDGVLACLAQALNRPGPSAAPSEPTSTARLLDPLPRWPD